ncbi:MAG: RNA 2',3'-cyclic phosphodiesterase [Sneathiella sp.]|jgi:2'-5' RNA ligase|uniref:RNA 2',3'-cyclic phosphodiesterase n=1 Tax=Sneathiella sp. TaxID=1964365 RepID=UPI000C4C5C58|nr:RNA 2',3'-cyclic phosphodiesterase [Sneathiella sp.]MAL78528.1 RNA 2',3'-cyclic phosphodiesterase [Sneathiella sp.]|tara:strand:+ start:129 stop:677 length:549 start_codon:yes stop_codon:yes gene_type:complete
MRLFVAIDLPAEIKANIGALRGGIPDARWIAAENAHVTLAFIGEVQGPMMMDISLALGRITYPAFDLNIEGVGVFGSNKRPRLLWAGVRPTPEICLLHQKIVTAIESTGARVDDRRFRPHVTLARVHKSPYEKVRHFLIDHALFKAPALSVENFSLFSSHLASSGAIYHEEVSFDLAAPVTS